MRKLLITGGAGFLGFHLCRKLSPHFDEIIINDIIPFNKKEYDSNVRYFKQDIRDKEGMNNLIKTEEPDFIIHAAAALPLYKPDIIMQVNIGGTKNILDAALEYGVKRVVFISSTAVYGVPEKHPLYEGDTLIGVGPYGETKIIAEKICEKYREKGLCIPIIRPKTFIGTHRLGVFQILYDWVEHGKKIPILGSGKNRYQLLEVEDLADAIHLTLSKPRELVNDTFNVGATYFETVYEDVSALCKYANSGARVMRTPASVIIFMLRIFEKMKLSPLYEWVYGTASKDSFVSVEKIQKKLGWKPKYSNSEALIRSYQWYLDPENELIRGTGVTHTVAWKQGILGLFKKIL
jgi:nucleoside-diphosphate-sugar epimerase